MAVSPRYEPGETIDEFFREHGAKVQTICRSMLDDSGEAEDAAQQVFLAAFRAIAAGTTPRRPEAWLSAIARNECRARAQARRPVVTTGEHIESPDADPSVLALKRAEVAAVWEAIGELPPTQREALLLREVRGLSYDELADDLQLTRPSIRSLLSRARQAIRARLGDGWAAIGGASWLESLTRLLAGGSTPAAIATKTAAVGLGAAAITGGAVVAPELTPHPRLHRAAVTVHLRHAAVAHARPHRAEPVDRDPVETAPSAPVRAVAASELVVARPVVHRTRHESEPTVRRVQHHSAVSSQRSHPSAAATFVSDHEDAQAGASQSAPTSSQAASAPVAQAGAGEGESSHDSGSDRELSSDSTASSVVTPSADTGETSGQAVPTEGESGTSHESDGSGSSTPVVQPSAPGFDGSGGWSDGSHQSDGSDGSDGSGGH